MLKQTALVFVFITLGLALFVTMEHSLSPVFQKCIDEREHEEIANAQNYKPASLGTMIVGANVRCSGDFVDSHGSGITALATLMIAAFTLTLWIATNSQVQLTRDALELLERAYIDPQIRSINVGHQRIGDTVEEVVNVSYMLQNLGRTVAFITELHQEIRFSDSKTPLPEPRWNADWKVRRPISTAPTAHFDWGNWKRIDGTQEQQITSDPPQLFVHFFLYVGYKDALPRSRDPIWLTGIVVMQNSNNGTLEPYADSQQSPQKKDNDADPSKAE